VPGDECTALGHTPPEHAHHAEPQPERGGEGGGGMTEMGGGGGGGTEMGKRVRKEGIKQWRIHVADLENK